MGPGDLEEQGSRGVRASSRPEEQGGQAGLGRGRQRGGQLPAELSWASGDLSQRQGQGGGRATCGLPQEGSCLSCEGPSRRGPGQRPRRAQGCGHCWAANRLGAREPRGFGAPSASRAGAGWGRPQAGWRGSRTPAVTNANTSLGQVNRPTTSGQPCRARPDLPGPQPLPWNPHWLPSRVASRGPCGCSVRPAPGSVTLTSDSITSPTPSSPRAPSGPSSVTGTSGLSECNSLPGPGRVPPVSAARRTGPSSALSQAHLVPDGEFPGPTHAPAGSLGTGGVGGCPSAWPVPGGYQNEGAPTRLASTEANSGGPEPGPGGGGSWRRPTLKGESSLEARVQPESLPSWQGLPGLREEGAGCWLWANAALLHDRARLWPGS